MVLSKKEATSLLLTKLQYIWKHKRNCKSKNKNLKHKSIKRVKRVEVSFRGYTDKGQRNQQTVETTSDTILVSYFSSPQSLMISFKLQERVPAAPSCLLKSKWRFYQYLWTILEQHVYNTWIIYYRRQSMHMVMNIHSLFTWINTCKRISI